MEERDQGYIRPLGVLSDVDKADVSSIHGNSHDVTALDTNLRT